ncbi:HVO_0649 family zinc finger protein [Haladaptatus sp. DYSN1]|uniref:HVO_0649 family zinc finger protein n=1 Tax=unclassified Haladaptatus TaxID=2622732 RepID=UPI0026E57535|nr:HVO_0649 family zinc finger protein [Haladaptatus sp. DYSN1]
MGHDLDDERSPFEKLKSHYDDVDMKCPECGYEDTDGEWQTETTGEKVHYHHICPSCGVVQKRTLSIDAE